MPIDLIQSAAETVDTAKQTLRHIMEQKYPVNARVHVKAEKLDYFGIVAGHNPDNCCIQIINEKTNKTRSINYGFVTIVG